MGELVYQALMQSVAAFFFAVMIFPQSLFSWVI